VILSAVQSMINYRLLIFGPFSGIAPKSDFWV
jgi:hypothetical protein